MLECRHCGEYIRGKNEDDIVRCPRCREPLFERTGGPQLVEGPLSPEQGVCALHSRNAAVAACKRCGNPMCAVCRTRWNERSICPACVERSIGSKDSHPEERAAHSRQAAFSLVFAIIAWVLVLISVAPFLLFGGAAGSRSLYLAGIVLIASLVPAMLGLGQAACAIRVRGPRLAVATCGLVLSGSHLGLFLGLMLLQISRG